MVEIKMFVPGNQRSDELDVLINARRWWESHRPDDWTEDQHLLNPMHRILGCCEQELARAVARMLINMKGDK